MSQQEEQVNLLLEKPKQAQLQCPKLNQQCESCKLKQAKYQCPKCKVPYCSLLCYKSHSEKCVQSHALEVEKDKYRGIKADFDTQKEMRKTLNRLHREFEDEPIEPYNLEQQVKRLEDLLQQDDIELSKLTLDEQKQFAQFVEDSKLIQKYIEPWKPWWMVSENSFSLYVEEVEPQPIDGGDSIYKDFRLALRDKLKTIVTFDKMSKSPPHPDIDHHLFNVVVGIALVARSFNGDFWSLSEEFIGILSQISVLSKTNMVFGTYYNSFQNLKQEATRYDKSLFQQYYIPILDDAVQIYSNKFYVVESLMVAYELMHQTQSQYQDQKAKAIEEPKNKQSLRKKIAAIDPLKYKVLYFVSLAMSKPHSYYKEAQNQIRDIINEEQKVRDELKELEAANSLSQQIEGLIIKD